jgi:hypothetical protein
MIGNIAAGLYGVGITPSTSSYESIATSALTGSVGTVTFTSGGSWSGYKHLQLRMIAQTDRPTYSIDNIKIRFNGDGGSNYARHALAGSGSSAYTDSGSSTTEMLSPTISSTAASNIFGVVVIDILDINSTSKYKTLRALGGEDVNGTVAGQPGYIAFWSGLWQNTAALTSIDLSPLVGSNFTQYSHFGLYGVKD